MEVEGRIRAERERRAWTQEELASRARMNVRTVQRAESGAHVRLQTLRDLALAFEIDLDALVGGPRKSAACLGVSIEQIQRDYSTMLRKHLEAERRALVFPRLTGRYAPSTLHELALRVETRSVMQIVGEGGMGKSFLAEHLMGEMIERGTLPIRLAARIYDGDIAKSLDTAVAPYTPADTRELLGSGEGGAPWLIVVDGFDECPHRLRSELAKDLDALRNRRAAALLISTRDEIAQLGGVVFRIAPYSAQQRNEIVLAHTSADRHRIDEALLRALSTPLDLTLAARCQTELPVGPTPYEVRLAYVRQCLRERSKDPGLALECLLRIARAMRDDVRQSLALSEVLHLLHEVAVDRGDPLAVGDELFDSRLVVQEAGRCTFAHELFSDFFQAELLLRAHPADDALYVALGSPRNARCRALVVQAKQDRDPVEMIAALEDYTLVSSALNGGLGEITAGLLSREVLGVLSRAEAAAAQLQALGTPDKAEIVGLSDGTRWSWLDRALLREVGRRSLNDVGMQRLVCAILRATDRALDALSSCHTGASRRRWRNALHRGAYLLHGAEQLPASELLEGVQRESERAEACAIEFARHVEGLGLGELQLALTVWTRVSSPAAIPDATKLWLAILDRCWRTDLYNLQLDALEMAPRQSHALDDSHRNKVIEWIEGLGTDLHPFLGTSALHALGELGAFEEAESLQSSVLEQLSHALEIPSSVDSARAAFSFVSNMFDHPVLTERYCEAEYKLSEAEKRTLYSAALLGAPDDSFAVALALRFLVRREGLSEDETARHALSRFARPPAPTSFMPHDAVEKFVLAVRGLALAGMPPPRPCAPLSDLDALWFSYGVLLHAATLDQRGLDRELAEAWGIVKSRPLCAALAPLKWITAARGHDAHTPVGIVERWPDHLRALVEGSLVDLDEVEDLYAAACFGSAWRVHALEPLQHFILELAGQVGDRGTRPLLLRWIDSRSLGAAAVQAVRKIDDRFAALPGPESR